MRNLFRDQRGVASFVFLATAIPLIGALALGAEGASWSVIKQRTQHAADTASIAGALALACQNVPASCADIQSVSARAKEIAGRNGFTDGAAALGVTQSVTIDRPDATSVRATITQHQPTYLARVLNIQPFDISAQAVAQVVQPTDLCALGLQSLSAGGTLSGATDCGLQSNNAISFSSDVSGPKFANAANGCTTGCGVSAPHTFYSLPATNPLQVLDTESFNSRTGNTLACNFTNGHTCSLSPNSTGAFGSLTVGTGDTVTFAAGTYFFYNATIKINGGTVTGTGVTLVLLGDSSLLISSNAHVDLSAPTTNAFSSALNGVLIDDQAPNKSNNAVTVNGGGTVKLGGAMYFPHVDVTWSGTAANANTTCSEVIADTLTITGNAYLSTQNCAPSTVAHTQAVTLVP